MGWLGSWWGRRVRRAVLVVAVVAGQVVVMAVGSGSALAAAFDVSIAAGGNPDPAPSGETFGYVDAIEVDADDGLWLIDRGSKRILRFAPGSTSDSQAVCELDTASSSVHDLALDERRRLFYSVRSDINVFDVSVCPTEPALVTRFVVPDTLPKLVVLADGLYFTQVDGVHRVLFDAAGDLELVADPGGSGDLVPVSELAVPTSGRPNDVAAGPDGELNVATTDGVWRFATAALPVGPPVNGVYSTGTLVFDAGGFEADEIAVDGAGNLFNRTNDGGDMNGEGKGAVVRVPAGASPTQVPSSRCADLSAAALASDSCIVIDDAAVEALRTSGVLDIEPTTLASDAGGGKVAVDSGGDLFIQAGDTTSLSSKNLVFRVEGAGFVPPSVEVCLGDASAVEGDASGPGSIGFPVTLSEVSTAALTVSYVVVAGTAQPGAGGDVVPGTGELVLPAGAGPSGQVLALELVGDELVEDDETFTVQLTGVDGPGVVGVGCGSATGTILDDDQAPTGVTTQADPAAIAEGDTAALSVTGVSDDGTEFTYLWSPTAPLVNGEELLDATTPTATFESVDEGVFVFEVEVCDVAAQCGTAQQSVTVDNVAPEITDVVAPSGSAEADSTLTVTFADPGTADIFDASIDWDIADAVAAETFADVGAAGPVADSYVASATHTYPAEGSFVGEVCITDGDGGIDCDAFTAEIAAAPLPVVSVAAGDEVTEGDDGDTAVLTFTISLSEPAASEVTVNAATTGGTATAISDYVPVDTVVAFAAGEQVNTVQVSIVGDTIEEDDETVQLSLSNPAGTELDPAATTAVATILDDDSDSCDIVATAGLPIVGTAADEVICGSDGNDIIDGGGGNDIILAGDGTDRLVFGANPGPVVVDLAAGTATGPGFSYTLDSIENVTGTAADDTIRGDDGPNQLSGLGGNDTIDGRSGNDAIGGNEGDDRLIGGDGDDSVFGHDGNDTISGRAGSDTIYGLEGDDRLFGGDDNDAIFGNEGNDRIFGQDGDDLLYGLQGDDLVSGGRGDDLVSGGTADDPPQIGGDDRLFGGNGDDIIIGGVGNDRLYGQNGNDALSGGDGTDLNIGGRGTDRCLTGERNLSCELP